MKPIIKWAGGKAALLPAIHAALPAGFRDNPDTYVEPFAGGAALFFNLAHPGSFLSDTNPDLIDMYKTLSVDPDGVIRTLRMLNEQDNRVTYLTVRSAWNDRSPSPISNTTRAAWFIYLNKHCFNGIWRVNKRGEFNVPWNKSTRKLEVEEDALRAAAELLAKTELSCCPAWDALDDGPDGAFAYLDPPYDIPGHTAYTADGFDRKAQIRLYDAACRLTDRGGRFLLSNSDTEFIRGLYSGWCRIIEVSRAGTINSKKSGRGRVPELLIAGGY